jgi:hypothetical protein
MFFFLFLGAVEVIGIIMIYRLFCTFVIGAIRKRAYPIN